MEIFSWHAGLAKWVEIGNSGMFRPEMLLPMGLPEDVSVIAWGLSLERWVQAQRKGGGMVSRFWKHGAKIFGCEEKCNLKTESGFSNVYDEN